MATLDWQSERFERWTYGVTLKHLHELKEIFRAGKPPEPIRMVVLAAMAVLRADLPGTPNSVQCYNFLKDPPALLAAMSKFDIDRAPEAAIKRFHQYLARPALAIDKMRAVSASAAGLCMWCNTLAARRQPGGINAGVKLAPRTSGPPPRAAQPLVNIPIFGTNVGTAPAAPVQWRSVRHLPASSRPRSAERAPPSAAGQAAGLVSAGARAGAGVKAGPPEVHVHELTKGDITELKNLCGHQPPAAVKTTVEMVGILLGAKPMFKVQQPAHPNGDRGGRWAAPRKVRDYWAAGKSILADVDVLQAFKLVSPGPALNNRDNRAVRKRLGVLDLSTVLKCSKAAAGLYCWVVAVMAEVPAPPPAPAKQPRPATAPAAGGGGSAVVVKARNEPNHPTKAKKAEAVAEGTEKGAGDSSRPHSPLVRPRSAGKAAARRRQEAAAAAVERREAAARLGLEIGIGVVILSRCMDLSPAACPMCSPRRAGLIEKVSPFQTQTRSLLRRRRPRQRWQRPARIWPQSWPGLRPRWPKSTSNLATRGR